MSTLNILFTCTTLDKESTLAIEYDYIHNMLIKIIPYYLDVKKNVYFVYKVPNPPLAKLMQNMYSSNIVPQLQKNNYAIKPNITAPNTAVKMVNDSNIHDFLSETKLKFDIISLTQCSNLVDTFIGEKITTSIVNIHDLIDNFITIYNSLEESGFIINFYYNEDNGIKVCDFIDYISLSSSITLFYHIYLLSILDFYYERIDEGIYRKNNEKINVEILHLKFYNFVKKCMKIYTDNGFDCFFNDLKKKYLKDLSFPEKRVKSLFKETLDSFIINYRLK